MTGGWCSSTAPMLAPPLHIRKMRNHTTSDPGPLSHTEPHDARSVDLTLRVMRFSFILQIFDTS